jgi:GDP-L-fucose synthase
MELRDKRILVTGGAGFIGSRLVEVLLSLGSIVRVADKSLDLIDKNLKNIKDKIEIVTGDLADVDYCLAITKDTDLVMNLSAKVAGIEYNRLYPWEMFLSNVRMNSNILESARVNRVTRFLTVSSACIYSNLCSLPTNEDDGSLYLPESTNIGYGLAKRLAEYQSLEYRKYGMEISIVRPYNAYGPRAHFDSGSSHVIPSLIKRVLDNEDPLVIWGSGEQTRTFLYVDDFVDGLIKIVQKGIVSLPINLGSKEEIKIKDLVEMILKISRKSPKVIYDTSKPEGQLRRVGGTTLAKDKLGFEAQVSLEEGLTKTIDYYKNTYMPVIEVIDMNKESVI